MYSVIEEFLCTIHPPWNSSFNHPKTGKSGLRSMLGLELSPVYSLVNVTMLMIQRV